MKLADWYLPREGEVQAIAGLINRPASLGGVRSLLVEGPPGSGKSALAEALAEGLESELVVGQLHSWSDSDQLFCGIDVAEAVSGNGDGVRQDGLLAVAARASARASATAPAVLLLDEIDKAPERAEALLLDCLQSGRVPVRPGEHLRITIPGLVVILTSNGVRPLGDALLRRCRRLRMDPLDDERAVPLVARLGDVPLTVAAVSWKACCLAGNGASGTSPQEAAGLAAEVMGLAASVRDVERAMEGWCARDGSGLEWVKSSQGRALRNRLWGEVSAAGRLR